jgi:hypothetical protein
MKERPYPYRPLYIRPTPYAIPRHHEHLKLREATFWISGSRSQPSANCRRSFNSATTRCRLRVRSSQNVQPGSLRSFRAPAIKVKWGSRPRIMRSGAGLHQFKNRSTATPFWPTSYLKSLLPGSPPVASRMMKCWISILWPLCPQASL